MSENRHRPNRYQPTRENFILQMKKLLYDLASQAPPAGNTEKPDRPPPGREQRAAERP